MTTNANQIQLSGSFVQEEDTAYETITPGMLIELYSDAGTQKVRKHSTAGGFGENAYAVEDPLQGKTATDSQDRTIADDYVAGERVTYHLVGPGARVQAWLKAGENVVAGDKLISAGDGTLKKTTGSPTKVFATALEALNISASGSVKTRIDVRIN